MNISKQFCLFAFLSILFPLSTYATHPLIESIRQKAEIGSINRQTMMELHTEAHKYIEDHGRVSPQLQRILSIIETRFYSLMSEEAQMEFQAIVAEVGAKMRNPIRMPLNHTPFWLMDSEEFAHYRTSEVPAEADIVVIGAGLTGSSAAYHLSEAARSGKKIVILEADRPGSQASGRNGGNFQLLPENYVDSYKGLFQERYNWLKLKNPETTESALKEQAERQVMLMLRFSYHNFQRFTEIVEKEKIDCDYSPAGWLRIASTSQEEVSLLEDMKWIKELGPKIDILSPAEIEKYFNIIAKYSGRLIHGSGNYHPYKFVIEILKRAMKNGVQLHTGVKVLHISQSQTGTVLIKTSEKTIEAGKVIVATNAFTPQLFPELDTIQCYPSQIMNLEHATHYLNGSTVTERCGDIYYNFPKSKVYKDNKGIDRGMLHFGLDFSHPVENPESLSQPEARSEELFLEMKSITNQRLPETRGRPPSRLWTGPMAFTLDRTPIIGFMVSKEHPYIPMKNIVIAAAFQGYGGSYCTQAGYVAAQMALTGETHSDTPEDIFSQARFIK